MQQRAAKCFTLLLYGGAAVGGIWLAVRFLLPWAAPFLVAFALATVLGWGLYGGRCAQFLFGQKAWKGFCIAQLPVIVLSAIGDSAALWQLSETVNGLMAIPNLIALALLTPELKKILKTQSKHVARLVKFYSSQEFPSCRRMNTTK